VTHDLDTSPKAQIKAFRKLTLQTKDVLLEADKVLDSSRSRRDRADQQVAAYRFGFAQTQLQQVSIESLADLSTGRVPVRCRLIGKPCFETKDSPERRSTCRWAYLLESGFGRKYFDRQRTVRRSWPEPHESFAGVES
jgi:hypothetical protein